MCIVRMDKKKYVVAVFDMCSLFVEMGCIVFVGNGGHMEIVFMWVGCSFIGVG